jgi:hypothetical protein
MDTQQRAILKAALADIENLAAPRHIDRVSSALGVDIIQFAKLGASGMEAVICDSLWVDSDASLPAQRRLTKRGEFAGLGLTPISRARH